MKKKTLSVFLLGLLSTALLGQDIEMKGQPTFDPAFKKFELPGGALGNSVQAIIQDSIGYMWFASQAGLHRYDGRNFETFKTDPNNPNTINSDYIEDIYLDSKGTIWLSHWLSGGITSYDPDNGIFKRYIHDPDDPESIMANATGEIIEDADGYIWVGGESGLSRLNPETGKFKRFISDPQNPGTLSERQVRGLYVDKEKTLWVATGMPWQSDTLGGLNRYISENESFERFIHHPDNPVSITNNKVRAMFEDSRGNFWIGSAGDGLHTLDKKTGAFTHFPYNQDDPYQLSKPFLKGEDPNNLTQYSHITSIYEDKRGRLWITAAYSGLNVYDPGTGRTYHFESGAGENELKTNFIWQTFQSDEGTIWIATGGDGQEVYKLREESLSFPFYNTNSVNVENTSISHGIVKDSNGKVLISSTLGVNPDDVNLSALWQVDRLSGEIKQINFSGSDDDASWFKGFVGSVSRDQADNIWIGTNNGYYFGNKEKSGFVHLRPDFVTNDNFGIPPVLSTDAGDIWMANWNSGALKYDQETGKYERFEHDPLDPESLAGPVVMSFFEDRNGNIWVGGGTPWYDPNVPLFLDRYNPQTKAFEHFIKELITVGSVSDITEDQNGNIWFIDFNDGLFKLNPETKELRKFTPYNSLLPRESLHVLFAHSDGNIWLSSDNSIIEIDPVSETISVYNDLHGVKPAWNFWNAGFLAEDGELLFARNGGFHAFNPQEFLKELKSNLPDLRITGFRLLDEFISSGISASYSGLDQPIWKTSEIELESYENIFSFSVACFDFYEPSANQIQFMLEGYDRGWRQDIRDGETPYYVNVGPGTYTFRLRGANSLGVWNKEGISLKVIVYAPWYLTWWAYVLYGLILVGGVLAVDRFQRKRLIRQEREKTQQRDLEQAREIEKAYTELKATQTQLIHSEKMASLGELTAGIAHEIQNPLNFVNNFSEVNAELIEELEQEADKGNIDEIKALAKDIKENEQKIIHHGKRADAIVKGMLHHSRSSNGVKEPADINALADEYLRLSYHGLRAKNKSFNADFKTEFDSNLTKVNVISQDIGRVLLNLINNAFYAVSSKASDYAKASSDKSSTEGNDYKPLVTVLTKNLGNQFEIRVKDNGDGIPDAIVNKIFQPFFTTKPTGQGTGLGLSLSYDIVKSHGGELKVKTREGEGSEFTIILPT
jgi:signal transduction histidine kinase/ligand-binding sensor domain-containing protein